MKRAIEKEDLTQKYGGAEVVVSEIIVIHS